MCAVDASPRLFELFDFFPDALMRDRTDRASFAELEADLSPTIEPRLPGSMSASDAIWVGDPSCPVDPD